MAFIVKYLLAVVVLVGVFNPILCQNEMKEAMKAMVAECKQKTGASEADLTALRNHKLPESKEGICMFECFFDNAKVMQDGKYNKDGLVMALTPMVGADEAKIAKLKEMAEFCGKELEKAKGDKCAIAQELMHCTVEEGKKFGFEYPNEF